jgi:hypothetical protein
MWLLTRHRRLRHSHGAVRRLPDDVCWQWMAITPAEFARVRFIDYDYWVELSGGTRLAVDAAQRIPDQNALRRLRACASMSCASMYSPATRGAP